MDHSFSWRKVAEATLVIVIIYVAGSPVLGTDLNPVSMLKSIGPFVVLFALSSKVLERVSEEEGEEGNVEYY